MVRATWSRFEYCTKDEAFARGSNPISPSSSSSAPQFFGQDAAGVGEAAESYSIEMKNYSFAHLACYEYQWNPFVILNAQVATQLVCIRRQTHLLPSLQIDELIILRIGDFLIKGSHLEIVGIPCIVYSIL